MELVTPIKIGEKVSKIFMSLLASELKAFYFYKNSVNQFDLMGFRIASKYCEEEFAAELTHAMKIEKYLVGWNVNAMLPTIDTPQDITSVSDFLSKAYNMEYELYEQYEEAASKLKEIDTSAFNFVQQFLQIQTESVKEYSDKINIVSGCSMTSKFEMLQIEEMLFGN